MTRTLFLLAAIFWSGAVKAQPDPTVLAQQATSQLEQATVSLQQAASARDRVRALTETVRAYESGLSAMRDGLRRAAAREAVLRRGLQSRQREISDLLGVLQIIETSPTPVLTLHPSGPLGSARSAMMLADVTPALQSKAVVLKAELDEIRTLQLLQKNAAETLKSGLSGVQTARAELSKSIANRTDLPKRFVEDPVRTAILIESAETLAGFASGLSQIAEGEISQSNVQIEDQKGNLSLPVRGIVLHRAGEADAAGIKRHGMIVATRARALVVSPTAATIRYRGPLLDLGNVVILEPQTDTMFVFSGLDDVYGDTGQVIPEGTPVGIMGGSAPQVDAILSLTGEGTGSDRSETLYIEVREGGSPVDPETWFRTDEDG